MSKTATEIVDSIYDRTDMKSAHRREVEDEILALVAEERRKALEEAAQIAECNSSLTGQADRQAAQLGQREPSRGSFVSRKSRPMVEDRDRRADGERLDWLIAKIKRMWIGDTFPTTREAIDAARDKQPSAAFLARQINTPQAMPGVTADQVEEWQEEYEKEADRTMVDFPLWWANRINRLLAVRDNQLGGGE